MDKTRLSNPSGEVKLLFGGDTSFGELWHDRMDARGKGNVLKEQGYSKMVGGLQSLVDDSHMSIVNLETALVEKGIKSPYEGRKRYINPGHPEHTCETLLEAGVQCASLANNHAFDYHMPGLLQTSDYLHSYGIRHFGAGKTLQQASEPLYWNLGKIHLYVIGCYWVTPGMDQQYDYYASADKAGVYGIDPDRLAIQIRYIKSFDPKSYVVVYPHWGENYKWRNDRQQALGHQMIRAGADLVVGHGAHQLQEIEWYQGKLIVYSLGNYIYGAPGRYDKKKGFPYSMTLQISFDTRQGVVKRFRLFPFFCDNRKTHYKSRLTSPEEMETILQRLIQADENPQKLRKRIRISEREAGLYFQMRPSGGVFSEFR